MQLLSNQAQKVEQKDNKMERPPPPIPWGLSAPRPWPSRAPSEKNQVEQEEDKKTKQKEDTEKPGVKASVCLDPDTPDDEEQNEKDMAVDHWQKEGDEKKKKKKEQVEQEKDQRTKVEKDKDPPAALQKREAQANRADTSIVTLCWTLLEFLTYVLRETWIVRSSEYHATEQAQSSGHATEQTQSQRHDEDCGNIVFDTIASVTFFEQTFYDVPALLLHKQMWDIMSRNKEGLAKENMFIEWCRRVQKHTEAPSTAVPSTDTEHVFKSLALDLLSNDLTPEQRRNPAYKVIKDKKTGAISVTTKQRSWINVILRKNLGHARVAYYIFNHGVPRLFNLPFRRKAPTKRMLQSMLQDLMTWHASLLYSILERPNHPGRANARMLAALGQTEWWMHRREQKLQVEQVKDQRAKVEKDKDFKKTKDKVTKVTKHHKQENEKEKDKVRISSSTAISSSTRSSSSTGISEETVEHQPQKKQKVEQEKKEVDMAATKSKMSSQLPSKQRNQWDPNTCQWEPKGTVGEEIARGKAVAKCEAFPAAESRADMRKEKARQLKATKHWAPVPGEKEFENVRRMSIAATQREEAQMRTPSPQRGLAPSRSRAPSPERREPYAEAVARSACRAASATCGSDDRRPEMPLPIRGIPAPDDTRLPMTHVEAEAKRAALAPPAAGKRIRSSSKTRAEALQERDLNSRLAAVDEYVGTLDDQKLENLKDTLNQIFRAGKVKLVPRGSASSSGFSTEEKLYSFADEIREIAREHRLDVVIISDIAKRFLQDWYLDAKDKWWNQPEKEFAEAKDTDMPTEDKPTEVEEEMRDDALGEEYYDRDRKKRRRKRKH